MNCFGALESIPLVVGVMLDVVHCRTVPMTPIGNPRPKRSITTLELVELVAHDGGDRSPNAIDPAVRKVPIRPHHRGAKDRTRPRPGIQGRGVPRRLQRWRVSARQGQRQLQSRSISCPAQAGVRSAPLPSSSSLARLTELLRWGHFSTVWLVKDAESVSSPTHRLCVLTDRYRASRTSRHSALKVVKSAGRYAETARDEIKLLARVSQASPSHPGRDFVVSFLDSFSHTGPESSHVCIVFEPLGENLLALIERHKKKGVPRPLVKIITQQVLLGLSYLHDECDLVHTDIKPENISTFAAPSCSPSPLSSVASH